MVFYGEQDVAILAYDRHLCLKGVRMPANIVKSHLDCLSKKVDAIFREVRLWAARHKLDAQPLILCFGDHLVDRCIKLDHREAFDRLWAWVSCAPSGGPSCAWLTMGGERYGVKVTQRMIRHGRGRSGEHARSRHARGDACRTPAPDLDAKRP